MIDNQDYSDQEESYSDQESDISTQSMEEEQKRDEYQNYTVDIKGEAELLKFIFENKHFENIPQQTKFNFRQYIKDRVSEICINESLPQGMALCNILNKPINIEGYPDLNNTPGNNSCWNCFSDLEDGNFYKQQCQHKYCNQCITKYINDKWDLIQADIILTKCPMERCNHIINLDIIEQALDNPNKIQECYSFIIKEFTREQGWTICKKCNNYKKVYKIMLNKPIFKEKYDCLRVGSCCNQIIFQALTDAGEIQFPHFPLKEQQYEQLQFYEYNSFLENSQQQLAQYKLSLEQFLAIMDDGQKIKYSVLINICQNLLLTLIFQNDNIYDLRIENFKSLHVYLKQSIENPDLITQSMESIQTFISENLFVFVNESEDKSKRLESYDGQKKIENFENNQQNNFENNENNQQKDNFQRPRQEEPQFSERQLQQIQKKSEEEQLAKDIYEQQLQIAFKRSVSEQQNIGEDIQKIFPLKQNQQPAEQQQQEEAQPDQQNEQQIEQEKEKEDEEEIQ